MTDPFDMDSKLRVVSFTEDNAINRSTLEFTASQQRMYRIETSADLVTWTAFSAGLSYFASPPFVSTTIVLLDHAAEQCRFYRPVAVLPLSQ